MSVSESKDVHEISVEALQRILRKEGQILEIQ
jgi:hypothetical protein